MPALTTTTPVSYPFNIAQTFLIDPARVDNADVIYVTSVNLYFKTLPSASSSTLLVNPGVGVFFAPVENDVPVLSQYFKNITAYKKKSALQASSSTLIPNLFTLNAPLPIKVGRKYAMLIAFDSNELFVPWVARAGEVDVIKGVRVNNDSGYVDGSFYQITNGKVLTALKGTDLTFTLQVAKFAENANGTFQAVNREYEFLTLNESTLSGTFYGGERVYKQTSNLAGSVSVQRGNTAITGTGTFFYTDFQVNDYVVLESGTSKTALQISSIASNTQMVVSKAVPFTNTAAVHKKTVTGKVYDYEKLNDTLILEGSTAANSSFRFGAGDTVVGVDSSATVEIASVNNPSVFRYVPKVSVAVPAKTSVGITVNLSDSTYNLSNTNAVAVPNNAEKMVDTYHAIIASRSNERLNSANLLPTVYKSMVEYIKLSSTNKYSSPAIKSAGLSFFVAEPDINDDSTNEHTSNGSARSKYISKRFDLTEAQSAEDLRVFLTAYRPRGTSIEAYARMHNPTDPDSFDSKDWTKLQLTSTANNSQYSDPINKGDTVNLEFAIPSYHTGTRVSGTFATTLSSNVVVGTSGTVNTDIEAGDVVRIYSSLFPTNYFITSVVSSNTTAFVIEGDSVNTSVVANSSLVSSDMLVDVIDTYKNSVFVDNQNNNIARYYNSSNAAFTTFRTFAIKLVLLSNTVFTTPMVYDMRAIALSA